MYLALSKSTASVVLAVSKAHKASMIFRTSENERALESIRDSGGDSYSFSQHGE